MRIHRHRRQILLFLIAILLPAAILIGLAARMMYQERELAAKRLTDQRHAAADQVRRELSARLEAIKLQEINRLIRSPISEQAKGSADSAVVFTAAVVGDRVVLPWAAPPPAESAEFAKHRQDGEAQEFVKKDAAAAAAAYRLALASARSLAERAQARLLLARSLAHAGNIGEASQLYHALLTDSSGARDEEGVGYRFYAAERLLANKKDRDVVTRFLRAEGNGPNRLTLPELYLVRSLLGADTDARISEQIATWEQALAMEKDIARIRAQIDAGASWVPYGNEPWLVTVTPPQPPLASLALAISSAKVLPPGIQLRARAADGESLGELFPGLRVEWSSHQFIDPPQRLPAAIWIAAFAFVLGLVVFGGYLLLRDVDRDVHMTEVRSQFVASVSHELKTPLTAIRMFAETLAMGRSRDECTRTEYLETIVNESERLARLVDNVLDFSKIEQGKKIYRLRPARLKDIAGSAVRAMQFPLAQQGFKLHFSAKEDLPDIQADADAIQQAILNLLTNAMKYSGDSRETDLRLYARNGDAVIEVVDRGLGLAPEEQKHIFEKFYRAPSQESQLIAGTGLGLTLVAHIAKAHHGRVEVESAPGAGSRFSIMIPIEAPV